MTTSKNKMLSLRAEKDNEKDKAVLREKENLEVLQEEKVWTL